jgi:hypothetical protein
VRRKSVGSKNDERFIAYFLDNFDFTTYTQGVSVPTLNRNSFAASLVAKPHLEDLYRKKRALLDELFRALLHKLMTGEIRAGDLDLSVLDGKGDGALIRHPGEGRDPLVDSSIGGSVGPGLRRDDLVGVPAGPLE